ncbi:hypothetical protein [Nocardia altamirensis]|uniref:hypothetical protein n=1 Tax=Nocardia altamirensis TaxID=472158 RepID=UPI00083FE671|nr:hypothetical protein [Nocardia altamirensis]
MNIFRRTPDPTKRAICGCGHHLALHDHHNGTCGHTKVIYNETDAVVRNSDGNPVLDRNGYVQTVENREYATTVACGCRHYIGPEPVTSIFPTPTYLPSTGS